MAWATENTSPDSAFLLVTDESWWKDPASEWFPALTQRASLATPQGYEWLPRGQFQQRAELYNSLQLCAEQESTCLQDWATTAQTPFHYVYVSKSCCSSLRHSLQLDADYELIYNEPGVVIFARRSP
jgi:hypothetical protein